MDTISDVRRLTYLVFLRHRTLLTVEPFESSHIIGAGLPGLVVAEVNYGMFRGESDLQQSRTKSLETGLSHAATCS